VLLVRLLAELGLFVRSSKSAPSDCRGLAPDANQLGLTVPQKRVAMEVTAFRNDYAAQHHRNTALTHLAAN
jgi:hypothetical protein